MMMPKKIRQVWGVLIFFSCLIAAGSVFTDEPFSLPEAVLDQAAEKYGPESRALLVCWQELIRRNGCESDTEKLQAVNAFFNRMAFVNDIVHWGKKDYWATPIEFLATRGGDCEDFSIAKYFTLKAMGISEDKLNLCYVKALRYNMAHMVLTYYESPKAEPLVLDNLTDEILPSSKRTDLIPIFSFNGSGLWLAKQRGKGRQAGSSSRITAWKHLLQKMDPD
ncbi:MAG: transglutaminase-like cysteine peptidase [Desulfobacterales bacterium]